jgi:pimeloyl-ACP methyl ester carboxylesterase
MADSNVSEFHAAAAGYESLAIRIIAAADMIRADPASLVRRLQAEVPDIDRRVIADAGIRSMLLRNYVEALRVSAEGWIDDVLAFCAPWGFDLPAITMPVLLWHGEADVFSPVSHARWLASQIPYATIVVRRGAAHFGALDALPGVLRWLTELIS